MWAALYYEYLLFLHCVWKATFLTMPQEPGQFLLELFNENNGPGSKIFIYQFITFISPSF